MVLKRRGSFRKRASAMAAMLLSLSLLTSGTYAAVVLFQHDTNAFSGDMMKYDATLNEWFEPTTDWKTGDGDVRKEISVTNTGLADGSYGNVYVRIQLKEYMEMEQFGYEYYTDADGDPILYMTNPDGSYEMFPSKQQAEEKYPGHEVAELTDAISGKSGWFVQTERHDPNGQYGKYVAKAFSSGAVESLIPGVARAQNLNHGKHGANEECAYTPHLWDDIPNVFAQYVQWVMGGDVIRIDDWDGEPTEQWILDTYSPEGWVYWGKALAPQQRTTHLMQAVRLIKQPDGNFYYVIHADMEADRYEDLKVNWGEDIPSKIIGAYKPRHTVVFAPNGGIFEKDQPLGTVKDGETVAPR